MSETFLYERIPKPQAELNVWLSFPGKYNFAMSSLGYLSIFKQLDEKPEYFVERIFTDTEKTSVGIEKVDLMGFSVSFEIDFLMFFRIFDKYNIPYKASERPTESGFLHWSMAAKNISSVTAQGFHGNRTNNQKFPLIFGGGPVLTANPEPYSDFFDFIIIGDGEEVNLKVTETVRLNKELPKDILLLKLSEIEGVYVPSLTKFNVETNTVTLIDSEPFVIPKQTAELRDVLATPILSEKSFFPNTYIIEIARGCPYLCRFCLASYLNFPYRCADYGQIIESIDFGLKYTNKLAFLGALIAGHPQFEEICDHVHQKVLNGEKIELSVSSLRANCVSDKIVQTLVACGQKHVTIAIEAGSERLRKIINKNLTEQELFDFVDTAYKNGLKGLKIYAMVGLPNETDEDIEELVNVMLRLKNKYKTFDFTLSCATFVPKAHTPFQFAPREKPKSLEKKFNYIKKHLSSKGIKVRVSSIKWDEIQALFSRGDRRLGDYAINVYKEGGTLGAFKQVYRTMEKHKLLPKYDEAVYDARNPQKNLVWNFIKVSPGLEQLVCEFDKFSRLAETLPNKS